MDHLRRLTVAFWLLLVSGLASAQITYTASGAIVPPAPANTLGGTVEFERFIRDVMGGGADVVDRYNGKIGGKTFPVEGARRLPAAQVARAAARALLNPYVIAGVVITAGAASTFCKIKTGSLVCDDTQAKQSLTLMCGSSNSSPTFCAPTLEGVAAKVAAHLTSTCYGCLNREDYKTTNSFSVGSCTASSCKLNQTTSWFDITRNTSGSDSYPNVATVGASPTTSLVCPAAPGYDDPTYHVAGGPPNWEGRCPKGVYHVPTEDELTAKLAPVYPAAQHSDVVREALEKKTDLSPLLQPQVVTGPASVTQSPTTSTTTSPTGTPQTTTTTTTNHITYQGSTFSWTTVNNTTYPDGSTKSEDKPPEDQKSECEMNPEAVGCQKLDEPDAEDIGTRDIPVSFNANPGWGAADASCPAPRAVTVLGVPVEIDNTLVCQFLSGIRFAIIGVSALVAGLIFVGGFRGQS